MALGYKANIEISYLGERKHVQVWSRQDMSKETENFNVTQGMTLLLLKKLSLPANFVFQLILFITDPENNIGYED